MTYGEKKSIIGGSVLGGSIMLIAGAPLGAVLFGFLAPILLWWMIN